jgi:hypothetical protein
MPLWIKKEEVGLETRIKKVLVLEIQEADY